MNNTGWFSRWKILNNKTEDSINDASTNHLRSVLSNRASSLISRVWSQSIHTQTLLKNISRLMISQNHNLRRISQRNQLIFIASKKLEIVILSVSNGANALMNPASIMHYYINQRSLSKSVSQEVNSARTSTDLIIHHFIYHVAVVMEQTLNVKTITMILNSKLFISVNGDNNS